MIEVYGIIDSKKNIIARNVQSALGILTAKLRFNTTLTAICMSSFSYKKKTYM